MGTNEISSPELHRHNNLNDVMGTNVICSSVSIIYQPMSLKQLAVTIFVYSATDRSHASHYGCSDEHMQYKNPSILSLAELSTNYIIRYLKCYKRCTTANSASTGIEHNYCTSENIGTSKVIHQSYITDSERKSTNHSVNMDLVIVENVIPVETEVIVDSMIAELPIDIAINIGHVHTLHEDFLVSDNVEKGTHSLVLSESPSTIHSVVSEPPDNYIVRYDALGENITFIRRETSKDNIEEKITEIWKTMPNNVNGVYH